MKSHSSFQMEDFPHDPVEAQAFLNAEIAKAFEMVRDAGAINIKDFNFHRGMGRLDPFGKTAHIFIEFDGDSRKTLVRPWGEVTS